MLNIITIDQYITTAEIFAFGFAFLFSTHIAVYVYTQYAFPNDRLFLAIFGAFISLVYAILTYFWLSGSQVSAMINYYLDIAYGAINLFLVVYIILVNRFSIGLPILPRRRKKLGRLLIEKEMLTPEQLEDILKEQLKGE